MKYRKPSTCKCRKPWYQILHRWRVLERGEKSLLKCLDCGWKWKSTRKYVKKLQDHVERHQNGLTDEDILARLLDNSLVVDLRTADVVSFTQQKKHRLQVIERHSNGSTYHFLTIRRHNKKKKIARHRLVWMAKHMQLVPQGYDVDHVKGKEIPYPDAAKNLELRLSSENRANKSESDDTLF